MSWRDRKSTATFRGVTFFVEASEISAGRRNVVHEYPQRDVPFAEDMGRAAREFAVEGYVIGDDYMVQRDRLLTALEGSGPGELVHPYYGKRQVSLKSPPRVRESTRDGGMATFSLEFVETPEKPTEPTSIIDAVSKAKTTAALSYTAVADEFIAKYVTNAALTSSVSSAIRSATATMNSALRTVAVEEQKLATLKSRITGLTQSAAALVRTPVDIVNGLGGMFDLVDSTAVLHSLYNFDPGERPPATTPNRVVEQQNYDATHRLIQRQAAIRLAVVTVDLPFTSYPAAIGARASVTDLLDEQADVAADDTYPVLLQLRADIVKAVPGDTSDLPQLVSFTPVLSAPSLVLAHRLYGDLSREQDILDRNGVEDPGFVRGGSELQVLSA